MNNSSITSCLLLRKRFFPIIKKELGSTEINEEVVCPVCQGQISNSCDVVHVRTLYVPNLGAYWEYDSAKQFEENKKYWKFDVMITDKNRDFFSKQEPRNL
ncbi:MAG: hypothetical protein J0665_04370 [Deltaproteobacteria bacterium]|nr:hypothetical protein [Deltaproteobacteria bacterium]